MMEEDLEYWQWIVDQRTEDLSLEMERAEDDTLIMLLERRLEFANNKIEELS